ncbi:hypothetical protein C8R44DRAFT_875721 [Mycena epipterygia]|nr:hypothetical protein C8R44DRAFT_875721 [Mycena epipterygia]
MPSLLDLPNELLMEMTKYYPDLLLDVDALIHGVRSEEFDGNDTLRALSQTCRRLRAIFLPVLWERVHACFNTRNRPKQKIKTRAKMLERRMRGIEKTPYVAPHIHSLTITLEECHMGNWQPMANFIRVLQLLPNLRFLGMSHVPTAMKRTLEVSLAGKVFPSVVALALSHNSALILHCFPNVHILTLDSWIDQDSLLDSIRGYCKHIHTINNITPSRDIVKRLHEAIPGLKRLSVWHDVFPVSISWLEGMVNLSDLRIRYPVNCHVVHAEAVIAAAKTVLRTSKATGPKEFRMQYISREARGHPRDIIDKETLFIIGGH